MKNFKSLLYVGAVFAATPALAKPEGVPFVSMQNPYWVIIIAFVLFTLLLIYLKVPGMVAGLLDGRANTIRGELDEARKLREEAQTLLASFERKQAEVAEHAVGIVNHARAEAEAAAKQAQEDLKASIARRLVAAEDQIASAEASAIKEVRDTAVNVAIAAASEVIAKSMSAKDGGALIDAAIADVGKKLH